MSDGQQDTDHQDKPRGLSRRGLIYGAAAAGGLVVGAAGGIGGAFAAGMRAPQASVDDAEMVDLSAQHAFYGSAEQAFEDLRPGLTTIDPQLTQQIQAQFANVNAVLDHYRDGSIPGGYEYWTAALKQTDASKISLAVQALQEPMSKVAEKVATAG